MVACVFSCATRNFFSRSAFCHSLKYFQCTASFSSNATVNPREIEKFTTKANEWWDKELVLLHSMNSVRVPFIRDGLLSMSGMPKKTAHPLKGYSIIDVGCGGGILSEPLARLGANVTGLDPGHQNIEKAIEHASLDEKLKDKLTYVCDTVENHISSPSKYDAVVCSEVVEHVDNLEMFVSHCVEITKDGGSLFFTTINRTALSYLLSIVFGEYITGLIPRGTHDWNKFVQPKELCHILESLNCRVVSVQGFMYNPVTKSFGWCPNTSNSYALHAVK
ncbi:ubiquinone biosynthesis O-methyltransferase, mitochondrial-like isoform X1 [Uloborus diversus]|uniref:ubiquinone biosynthesis O-methyltransferase, mitochondrial-like isoform X1 n=1 Tax=Uloborus diversus TaxID=327109 RepID=UPI00240A3EF4|nr:ubiquinone biosynthesis O-methyltransferase, mitochondrial-like isoform X1 [Uloborus diversus]